MANREYSTLSAENSMEPLAPPTTDRQGGYMQKEPEPEVASESESVCEDSTIFSGQQYAALTDTGEWKMHEPSPPWTDGSLPQQYTLPPPANNLPR
jgi:hypothetical protein